MSTPYDSYLMQSLWIHRKAIFGTQAARIAWNYMDQTIVVYTGTKKVIDLLTPAQAKERLRNAIEDLEP